MLVYFCILSKVCGRETSCSQGRTFCKWLYRGMLVFAQNNKRASLISIHDAFSLETAVFAIIQYDHRLPGHTYRNDNSSDL